MAVNAGWEKGVACSSVIVLLVIVAKKVGRGYKDKVMAGVRPQIFIVLAIDQASLVALALISPRLRLGLYREPPRPNPLAPACQ